MMQRRGFYSRGGRNYRWKAARPYNVALEDSFALEIPARWTSSKNVIVGNSFSPIVKLYKAPAPCRGDRQTCSKLLPTPLVTLNRIHCDNSLFVMAITKVHTD
jgi:hypothetical protein